MKNVLAIFSLTLLVSCGHSEKETVNEIEKPRKEWQCDSITETFIDSTGKEVVNTVRECDSVLINPVNKD